MLRLHLVQLLQRQRRQIHALLLLLPRRRHVVYRCPVPPCATVLIRGQKHIPRYGARTNALESYIQTKLQLKDANTGADGCLLPLSLRRAFETTESNQLFPCFL